MCAFSREKKFKWQFNKKNRENTHTILYLALEGV